MHSKSETRYTLKEAAKQIGVAPVTLKRWLLAGKVAEVSRDRNGWRSFTLSDIDRIKQYALMVREPASK